MIRITTTPPLEEKSSLDYKNLPTAQIYHNLYPSCSIDTHSSNLSTKFSSLIQYLRKPARSLQEAFRKPTGSCRELQNQSRLDITSIYMFES